MDIVYLDYNYGGLNDLGYYWLEVIVTLTAREVHDGYQYLFLYNTSECQSSAESLLENFIPKAGDSIKQGMLFKEQFEIGPGYKKTSWEERSFRFYVPVGNMETIRPSTMKARLYRIVFLVMIQASFVANR